MLKRIIVVIGAIVIGNNSIAQSRLGLTTSIDINFPISDALYQYPTPGYSYGIVGEYLFSDCYGVKVELIDSNIRYGYAMVSSAEISAIQQCKLNLISLPVQGIWRISLSNGLYLNACMGLQYSMLCSGSAFICDQYGQGDLWELCLDSIKVFDFPEYHEITLYGINSKLLSGIASLEISSKHLGLETYFSKGISPLTKQAPFVYGTMSKTLNKIGFKLLFYM